MSNSDSSKPAIPAERTHRLDSIREALDAGASGELPWLSAARKALNEIPVKRGYYVTVCICVAALAVAGWQYRGAQISEVEQDRDNIKQDRDKWFQAYQPFASQAQKLTGVSPENRGEVILGLLSNAVAARTPTIQNSGNIASLNNSPGASVNQSLTTAKKPFISEKRILAINAPTVINGRTAYTTTVQLQIGNPPDRLEVESKRTINVIDYKSEVVPEGTSFGFGSKGLMEYKTIQYKYLTAQPLDESDLEYTVRAVATPP